MTDPDYDYDVCKSDVVHNHNIIKIIKTEHCYNQL